MDEGQFDLGALLVDVDVGGGDEIGEEIYGSGGVEVVAEGFVDLELFIFE